jgi:pyrroloquinoline quinone biosynthesis protein D
MRVCAIIEPHSQPALPDHVRLQFDTLRQSWVLLSPERVMWPDQTSVEILKQCDGKATTSEIVAALAKGYAAPEDEIRQDVTAFLQEWADKRLIICLDKAEA